MARIKALPWVMMQLVWVRLVITDHHLALAAVFHRQVIVTSTMGDALGGIVPDVRFRSLKLGVYSSDSESDTSMVKSYTNWDWYGTAPEGC
jgi:hypothetical protein